jgi:hypothetical protein
MEVYASWGRTSTSPGCSGFSDVAPIVYRVADYDGWTRAYKVQHFTNKWRMYRNDVEMDWVGESSICWTPGEATWFGETLDISDSIGGLLANKYFIRETKYSPGENWPFYATTFNVNNSCNIGPGAPDVNGPPFFCDIVLADRIDIWTQR